MLVPRAHLVYRLDPTFRRLIEQPRRAVPVVTYLLTPVALVAYVFAFWRLGADLNWVGEFFISQGLLSRWQVWLAIGIATQIAARELNRLGRPDDTVTP
jgi:hypothetical protein